MHGGRLTRPIAKYLKPPMKIDLARIGYISWFSETKFNLLHKQHFKGVHHICHIFLTSIAILTIDIRCFRYPRIIFNLGITFNSRWWNRVWPDDRSYFCQKKFWAITTPRQIVINHNCCKYFGPIMFREIFRANHISRTIPPFIRIRPAFAALPDYYFD